MEKKSVVGIVIGIFFIIVIGGLVGITIFTVVPGKDHLVTLHTVPPGKRFNIPAGKSFDITCTVYGGDPHHISAMDWLDPGGAAVPYRMMSPNVTRRNYNSITLFFTNSKVEDSGIYTCSAVYEDRSIQKAFSITFHGGGNPKFRTSFEDVAGEQGQYLEIPCSADGDYPITYVWFDQSGDKMTEDTQSSSFVLNAGSESILVFPDLRQKHEGMYTCSASNQRGLSSKIYNLTVLSIGGPDERQEVSLYTVPPGKRFNMAAGQSFKITCVASGSESTIFSTIKWLDSERNVVSESFLGSPGYDNSISLTFTDGKVEDSGSYTCKTYYDGQQIETAVSITFHSGGKPSFISKFESIVEEEGSYYEIPCSADGDYPITYEWHNQNDDKISEEKQSSLYVSNVEGESTLVFSTLLQKHAGVYTCSASNLHGLSSKIYELTVLSSTANDANEGNRLIVPLNVTTVDIKSDSVKFDFKFSAPVTYIKVFYNESHNASSQYTTEWKYGDDYEVKDLIAGGSYVFKFNIKPWNDSVVYWTDEFQVTLLPGVPEVTLQNVANGTVKLTWFQRYGDSEESTIDKYELAYFSQVENGNGSRSVPDDCAITVQIPRCTASSYTISGLSAGVNYEIQLRAHTVSGYGEPYKKIIFIN